MVTVTVEWECCISMAWGLKRYVHTCAYYYTVYTCMIGASADIDYTVELHQGTAVISKSSRSSFSRGTVLLGIYELQCVTNID